ncbi:MAG: winged helix-turn-helix domain-containing protein [Candidatus Hodarchaeota archaeon]
MAKKEEKKEKKKKPMFEKVGLVFRSPVRADILKELAESPQQPIEIAENIGIQKQNINYHLNALKRGGIIQARRDKFTEEELPKGKGMKIIGKTENGKIEATYGVELTKNGKDIVNHFISPLYEENISEEDERTKEKDKKNKKEDEKV